MCMYTDWAAGRVNFMACEKKGRGGEKRTEKLGHTFVELCSGGNKGNEQKKSKRQKKYTLSAGSRNCIKKQGPHGNIIALSLR